MGFLEIRRSRADVQAIEETGQPTILYKYHTPLREPFQYRFDADLVRDFMWDYVNEKDSSSRFRIIKDYGSIWGIGVYKWLSMKVSDLSEQNAAGLTDHLRNSFRILWEHKKCILTRIQYMREHGYLQIDDTFFERFVGTGRENEQGAP